MSEWLQVVVDTSALLAIPFGEPDARWVARKPNESKGDLKTSTVDLAEALILVRDRDFAKTDARCVMLRARRG